MSEFDPINVGLPKLSNKRKFNNKNNNNNKITENVGDEKKERKNRKRKKINDEIREQSWEIFVGTNKQTMCLGCGMRKLHKTKSCGYESSHIVAQIYLSGPETPFNILPSCPGCNSECGTDNYFDYLYKKQRISKIKYISERIYKAYKEKNGERVKYFYNDMMHKVIENLYGPEKYKNGGIKNIIEIIKIIKTHQIGLLSSKLIEKSEELNIINNQIKKILLSV